MATSAKYLKLVLLAGTGMCLIATPAFAQSAKLDEVVVTATKRSESEQDVSISMETVSGESLVKTGTKDFERSRRINPKFFHF